SANCEKAEKLLNEKEGTFNLSDDYIVEDPINWTVRERDKFWKKKFKEFIRKLKEEVWQEDVLTLIDKLAGKELI
ncbi:unnamed protein product, partial [marine sediment metagenome]